jgi:hypothetical protein
VRHVVEGALLARLRRILLDRFGVDRSGIDVHAGSWLPEIGNDEADDQGKRRHDLEIDNRLQADAADLLHVFHAGDAVNDGAEDDRCDHHLDCPDEHVAERLHLCAQRRIEMSEQDADRDRTQHLDIEMLVKLPMARRRAGWVRTAKITPPWSARPRAGGSRAAQA